MDWSFKETVLSYVSQVANKYTEDVVKLTNFILQSNKYMYRKDRLWNQWENVSSKVFCGEAGKHWQYASTQHRSVVRWTIAIGPKQHFACGEQIYHSAEITAAER